MAVIRVRATEKCFYGGRIRREGTVFNFEGDPEKLPSWAKKVSVVAVDKTKVVKPETKTTLHQKAEGARPKVSKPNIASQKIGNPADTK